MVQQTQPLANIFKSYDIRGQVDTELTPQSVTNIARAFADWLPELGIVAVGHDMRPDSSELAEAFMEGLKSQGYDVWDVGLVTSDMAYFAVGKWELAGCAVITASHNPGKDNGIKLYRDQVVAVGLDSGLAQIRDKFLAGIFEPPASHPGQITKKEIYKEWVDHCLTFIGDLKPFNIAIDAGNGMAGKILPEILPKLPLNVEEMYFKLDGTFPNHEANPQKAENLQDLIKVITDKSYDFGIAFDGDGDRAAFVDDLGRPVLGTDLLSIVAKHYLQKYPGAEIIHEVRTSRATRELIEEWGGKPVRVKAGRIIIGRTLRDRNAPFGGETTGHFFFKENYDADAALITALVAMQAISDSKEKLSELVNKYQRYEMIMETNFEVADKEQALARLRNEFADGEQDETDGLTVDYPDYWFNIRSSNTEPLMRLNAEAKTKDQLDECVAKIANILTHKTSELS